MARVYWRGYDAAVAGVPITDNPYAATFNRDAWGQGWRDAVRDGVSRVVANDRRAA